MISEPTPRPLTSSSAATPANPSPSPENEGETPIPDTSGPSLLVSFAYYDRESLSLRTSQATLDLDLMPSSLTLPPWGWMSGGELYERVMSAPLTSEHGSSSLLRTPTAAEAKNQDYSNQVYVQNQVKALLPSPQSSESTPTDEFIDEMIASGIQPDERLYMPGRKWHTQRTLLRIAPTLLPTPTAQAAKDGTQAPSEAPGLRPQDDFNLWTAMQRLPTPTARDGKGSGNNPDKHLAQHRLTGIKHRNEPTGEFTKPPSDSGNTSLDDQPLHQLTIEED